jgi:hypothetical protein
MNNQINIKMEAKKHHYRNVFKSDHLGSADLEDLIEQGKPLIFTIREVKQEHGAKVAGKKIDANIAYFVEPIKPMVLNATNSKQMRLFTGSPMVEDWSNQMIELYVDENVQMKGVTTQGVRIRPIQPKVKPNTKPLFTEANFDKAKKANATKEQIEKIYTLTDEVYQKYLSHEATV